jgi:hypothetical protein
MVFVTAAISSLLLLELFWVHWGKSRVYETVENDVVEGVIIARNRAIILDTAIVLSLACVFGVSITIFAVDFERARETSEVAAIQPPAPPSQGANEVAELKEIANNLKNVSGTLVTATDAVVNARPWYETDSLLRELQTSTNTLKDTIDNLSPLANALLIELKRSGVSAGRKPAPKHGSPSRR